MVRSSVIALVALGLGTASRSVAEDFPAAAPAPVPFSISVPAQMVTGQVLVRAIVDDPSVAMVKWHVGDRARRATYPFDLVLDVGRLPHEQKLVAVAYDAQGRVLHRREATLNPGGRRVAIEILSPVDGQRVVGSTRMAVRVEVPAGEGLRDVSVERHGQWVPLRWQDGGVFTTLLDVADQPTAVVVRLNTARGAMAERAVFLNPRGLLAISDSHVVEQMVRIVRGGEPVEDLTAADFAVRDSKGPCEIREVKLVRDLPLKLGVSIDTSLSLAHTDALRHAVAEEFLSRVVKQNDIAFLHTFSRVVSRRVAWSPSPAPIEQEILDLSRDELPGTVLHEAIVKALYEFQGSQGARALILVTDGNAVDDDVSEEDALEYARRSGVRIYALALPWGQERTVTRVRKGPGRKKQIEAETRLEMVPPNVEVLKRFTEATAGKTYVVEKATDLPRILASIERDIRTQYLVSYVSNVSRQSAFHPVDVATKRGRVQTVAGFYY